MGAAVTVSNAETSRAVRAELLLNVSACVFLPNLEDNMEKLLSFITYIYLRVFSLVVWVGLLFYGERTWTEHKEVKSEAAGWALGMRDRWSE